MIPLAEQIKIALNFVIFGMFIGVYLETMLYIFDQKRVKKATFYIGQILTMVVLALITLRFVNVISKGFVPIYLFLFFFIGWIIYYYFLKKDLLIDLERVKNVSNKFKINFWVIIFPVELVQILKKIYNNTIRKGIMKIKARREKAKNDKNKDENDNLDINNSVDGDD